MELYLEMRAYIIKEGETYAIGQDCKAKIKNCIGTFDEATLTTIVDSILENLNQFSLEREAQKNG